MVLKALVVVWTLYMAFFSVFVLGSRSVLQAINSDDRSYKAVIFNGGNNSDIDQLVWIGRLYVVAQNPVKDVHVS